MPDVEQPDPFADARAAVDDHLAERQANVLDRMANAKADVLTRLEAALANAEGRGAALSQVTTAGDQLATAIQDFLELLDAEVLDRVPVTFRPYPQIAHLQRHVADYWKARSRA